MVREVNRYMPCRGRRRLDRAGYMQIHRWNTVAERGTYGFAALAVRPAAGYC